MSREGVTHDQLTRGEPSAELNNVVYEVASTAKVCLQVRDKHLQVIQLVLVDDVLALVIKSSVELSDSVPCRLIISHYWWAQAPLGTVLENTGCVAAGSLG